MGLSKLQQAADLFKLGDLVQAERLYSEALISHPECGKAYLGMGVIALKFQQFDKAVSSTCLKHLMGLILRLMG
jgi:tetratricopeptide (TPR) repeat protein